MVKKVLFSEENWYFWDKGDLNTDLGQIKEIDIEKGGKVTSNKDKVFYIFEANFFDKIQKIKRLPQAVMEKDISSIIVYGDISKDSTVLEAGTGSGKLTCYLARYAKKVISFDINKEFLKVAKKNFKDLNLENIEINNKSIYDKVDLKDKVDAVILDLSEPWRALENVENNLKEGGVFVAYLPTIVQVIELVEKAKNFNLLFLKCIENSERGWVVDNKRVRPENKTQFTAFLVFFRKF